ncbi:MAG: hypothetical protein GXO86_13670 [Chlorobi bacterium]|nr:hypothetical protein [Chlorobiota bacterium]
MKKVIHIVLFAIFAVALAGLMGFIYIEQGRQPVKDIVININRPLPNGFLDTATIKQAVMFDDSLEKTGVKDISLRKIEQSVLENPFAEAADAYVNIDNELVINVKEKTPVLRIFNKNNTGFYVDNQGKIFPLSGNYAPRILIANGYFDIPYRKGHPDVFDSVYKDTPLADLYILTRLIRKNTFLNAQISQVYVNSIGEFDLIPELGNHLIRFGTPGDAEQKLKKLELFYKKALIKEGWDKYEIINLKYKNQVVCEKK